MADLFISYAREDRDTAQSLALALEQAGLTVWWDRRIAGGSDFTRVIAESLAGARLVLVLWSEISVQSSFVRDESSRARDAGKLLPVRIEEVQLPLGFGQIHTLDLLDWDGDTDDPAWQALLAEIRHLLEGGPRPPPVKIARRRPWWRFAWVGLILLALFGGYGAWQWQRGNNAERFFQAGLQAQFGRDPNLESARNQYLSALELRPRHARTHYYLGHVYAQLQLLLDARDNFQAAVSLAQGLDAGQIRDARVQLAALTVRDEPAPVARPAVDVQPAPPPAGSETPAVAPVQVRPPHISGLGSAGRPAEPPIASVHLPREVPFRLPPGAQVHLLGDLPHVQPSEAVVRKIEPLVAGMFAPGREARVTATTSLVVDLEQLSDAVPLALQAALEAQQARHPGEADLAAARSGVINTLVLLRAAGPMTLRMHADQIRHLLELARPNGPQTVELADQVEQRLDAAKEKRPVAWIQIAAETQRPLAERLAERLRQAGYDAPGIENVGDRAPAKQSEIRVHGDSDQGLARWQALVMGTVPGLEPKVRVLRKAKSPVDSYEIWFDRETCVTRQVAVCN